MFKSPLLDFSSLIQRADIIGPNITHINPLNESSQGTGIVKLPILISMKSLVYRAIDVEA